MFVLVCKLYDIRIISSHVKGTNNIIPDFRSVIWTLSTRLGRNGSEYDGLAASFQANTLSQTIIRHRQRAFVSQWTGTTLTCHKWLPILGQHYEYFPMNPLCVSTISVLIGTPWSVAEMIYAILIYVIIQCGIRKMCPDSKGSYLGGIAALTASFSKLVCLTMLQAVLKGFSNMYNSENPKATRKKLTFGADFEILHSHCRGFVL